MLQIALMHFAPAVGDIAGNAERIERAMRLADEQQADWFLTPELALTGYHFQSSLGVEWIPVGPDRFVDRLARTAAELEMHVFLSHLEGAGDVSGGSKVVYNTLFVIDPAGRLIGKHRKINTIPQSESWATPGRAPTVVGVEGYRVGLLICADVWPPEHARYLKERGADLIVSPANWGPGPYGPEDTWEKRSRETGLPIIVNNRTGVDGALDMRRALSVVAQGGERVFEFASERDRVIVLEMQRARPSPRFLKARSFPIP